MTVSQLTEIMHSGHGLTLALILVPLALSFLSAWADEIIAALALLRPEQAPEGQDTHDSAESALIEAARREAQLSATLGCPVSVSVVRVAPSLWLVCTQPPVITASAQRAA